MKVLLRVDGNSVIGLGHLYRCLALATMLKDDFDPVFYSKYMPEEFLKEIQKKGITAIIIKDDQDFLKHIDKNSIVVIDGYHFDTPFQRQIKSLGVKLVCIDDICDRRIAADLVINHTNGISVAQYEADVFTQFALGFDYVLLRPAFLQQVLKERPDRGEKTVMICFGGSDFRNLTEIALRCALSFETLRKIIIITGYSHQINKSLRELVYTDSRIVFRNSIDETGMLETMNESEIAIVPSSTILLEAIAAGCRIVSGLYVENQKFLYENLKRERVFKDAGRFSYEELHEALGEAISDTSVQKQYIDGKSGMRINKLFNQLRLEFAVNLRKASKNDLDLTFRWATDPIIRRYSFSSHRITKNEHTDWFTRKINNPECCFLIAEKDEKPIGSIRFDQDKNDGLISYLIDPVYHGNGLGQILLKKGMEWLSENNKLYPAGPIRTISGIVMTNNIASIKAFERLGFTRQNDGENYKFVKLVS